MVFVKTKLRIIIANVGRTFGVEIARYLSIHVNRILVRTGLVKVIERDTIAYATLATQGTNVIVQLIIASQSLVRMEFARVCLVARSFADVIQAMKVKNARKS